MRGSQPAKGPHCSSEGISSNSRDSRDSPRTLRPPIVALRNPGHPAPSRSCLIYNFYFYYTYTINTFDIDDAKTRQSMIETRLPWDNTLHTISSRKREQNTKRGQGIYDGNREAVHNWYPDYLRNQRDGWRGGAGVMREAQHSASASWRRGARDAGARRWPRLPSRWSPQDRAPGSRFCRSERGTRRCFQSRINANNTEAIN